MGTAKKNCWTGYNCCCDTVAKMCTIRCENKSTGENAFNPQNGLDYPRYTHSKTEVYNKVESNLYGRCNDDCAGTCWPNFVCWCDTRLNKCRSKPKDDADKDDSSSSYPGSSGQGNSGSNVDSRYNGYPGSNGNSRSNGYPGSNGNSRSSGYPSKAGSSSYPGSSGRGNTRSNGYPGYNGSSGSNGNSRSNGYPRSNGNYGSSGYPSNNRDSGYGSPYS